MYEAGLLLAAFQLQHATKKRWCKSKSIKESSTLPSTGHAATECCGATSLFTLWLHSIGQSKYGATVEDEEGRTAI